MRIRDRLYLRFDSLIKKKMVGPVGLLAPKVARPSGLRRFTAKFSRIASRCSGRTYDQGIMSALKSCALLSIVQLFNDLGNCNSTVFTIIQHKGGYFVDGVLDRYGLLWCVPPSAPFLHHERLQSTQSGN